MTCSRVLALIITAVGVVTAGRYGPGLLAHWRADRTAGQFGPAVFEADSVAIASTAQWRAEKRRFSRGRPQLICLSLPRMAPHRIGGLRR